MDSIKERGEQAARDVRREFLEECEAQHVTIPRVVRTLKKSLLAKKTQLIKIKGVKINNDEKLPRGVKIIASTVDETILSVTMDELRLRFDTAKEFAMLFDLKPAEKHEHTGKDGGPIETKHDPMSLKALQDAIKDATPK